MSLILRLMITNHADAQLLRKRPEARLNDFHEIRKHPFFYGM